MIDAVEANGVKYVQGHSKIYNPPVRKMREVVAANSVVSSRSNTWNYRNWLNQPYLETEVNTETGGGVCYRQGPHQTDVVRCIGDGMVKACAPSRGSGTPTWTPGATTRRSWSSRTGRLPR